MDGRVQDWMTDEDFWRQLAAGLREAAEGTDQEMPYKKKTGVQERKELEKNGQDFIPIIKVSLPLLNSWFSNARVSPPTTTF
jgi:hypothetical protein